MSPISPLRAKTGAATPELPLLKEVASELAGFDDFQLLPAAVVDCDEPWGSKTPATTLPVSPDAGSGAQDSEDEREGSCGSASFWPHESTAGSGSDSTNEQETYIPMWCRLEYEANTMRVIPFSDGQESSPPDNDAVYMRLWCWVQPQSGGGSVVVPCTDKGFAESVEQVNIAELPAPRDFLSELAEAFAPTPPAPDAYVPEWFSGPTWPFNAQPTTLMLSNLPEDLTQEDLLEVLDREEFNGFYDFVFLPENVRDKDGQRYAIVNLVGHQYGLTLAARLHGKTRWGVGDGSCACSATWALPYQGLADLVEAYRDVPENSSDVPADLRPQVFSRGWQVPFPSLVQMGQ